MAVGHCMYKFFHKMRGNIGVPEIICVMGCETGSRRRTWDIYVAGICVPSKTETTEKSTTSLAHEQREASALTRQSERRKAASALSIVP